MLKLPWQGLFCVGRLIIPWLCTRPLLGLFMALCYPRCHLMALASAAWVLCHFLAWDFCDAAARTRGKTPSRHLVLQAQMFKHVNPQGNQFPVGRTVGDKCYPPEAHSAQLLWVSSRTEPRMYYGIAALIFRFMFCILLLLFLGILSPNKYLWEMPCCRVRFPMTS